MVTPRKNPQKLIVILGPTASGKTGWSIKLAKQFNGYVISADSRQVYKEMNVGTDKIKKSQMQGVKHYMLDVVKPGQRFTVSQFQAHVNKIIAENPDQIPFLVGGTGLYIEAVVYNYNYPKKGPQLFDVLQIGIKKDREELYKKIDKRALEHWDEGLEREVKKLVKKYGYPKIRKMGLGYKSVVDYLKGKIDKAEAQRQHQRDTRRYAKRQFTWFKRDKSIEWVKNITAAKKKIKKFLDKSN